MRLFVWIAAGLALLAGSIFAFDRLIPRYEPATPDAEEFAHLPYLERKYWIPREIKFTAWPVDKFAVYSDPHFTFGTLDEFFVDDVGFRYQVIKVNPQFGSELRKNLLLLEAPDGEILEYELGQLSVGSAGTELLFLSSSARGLLFAQSDLGADNEPRVHLKLISLEEDRTTIELEVWSDRSQMQALGIDFTELQRSTLSNICNTSWRPMISFVEEEWSVSCD